MTPVDTRSCPFWTEGLEPGIEINLLLVFFWKLVVLRDECSAEGLFTPAMGAAILLLALVNVLDDIVQWEMSLLAWDQWEKPLVEGCARTLSKGKCIILIGAYESLRLYVSKTVWFSKVTCFIFVSCLKIHSPVFNFDISCNATLPNYLISPKVNALVNSLTSSEKSK